MADAPNTRPGWIPATQYPDPAIEALDPRFEKYWIKLSAVERLATGCRWSEGPVWFGDGRYLLWSDIPNNRILKWEEEAGAVSVYRKPSDFANGHTRDRILSIDDPCAPREADPFAVRIAIGRRHFFRQLRRIELAGDAGVLRLDQQAEFVGQNDIGRAILRFCGRALDQPILVEYRMRLDARLGLERLYQRPDKPRLTIGVDVDIAVGMGGCWHAKVSSRNQGGENQDVNGGAPRGRSHD